MGSPQVQTRRTPYPGYRYNEVAPVSHPVQSQAWQEMKQWSEISPHRAASLLDDEILLCKGSNGQEESMMRLQAEVTTTTQWWPGF